MLEAGVLSDDIVFEAEHDSECYFPDHDHSICVQHAQQRWLKTSFTPPDPPPAPALVACATSLILPEFCRRHVHRDSRAPPLA